MIQAAKKPRSAAVIGLGIGEQHLIGLREIGGWDRLVACDISDDKLNQIRSRYPEVETTKDWQEVVEADDVGIVSIASFDDVHYEQVVALAERGKHLFVEKPLCQTAEQVRHIKQLVFDRKVLLGSNLVLRAAPLYKWLKQEIANGRFGELYAFDVDYLYGRIHKIIDGWRKDVEFYSVMQGGGIHMVDLMLWLAGEKPTHVQSTGNRICTSKSGFRFNDFSTATLWFPSGMIGRANANFGCVHRHQHAMRIFGTKATFILDDQGPRLIETRDPEVAAQKLDISIVPAHKWDLIPDFVEQSADETLFAANAQREFDTLSVCLASDCAMASSQRMEIEYL